jgi:GNAT superfamily N-acetyltransferase
MNSEINKAATCFIGYIENNPVCFFSVLHFPHPKVKNFKKGHRLVVLPDYQGLGIGHKFSSEIAEYYKSKGFRFVITSSTKSLFKQRQKDPRWKVTRHSRAGNSNGVLKNTTSENKYTFSYEYVGKI